MKKNKEVNFESKDIESTNELENNEKTVYKTSPGIKILMGILIITIVGLVAFIVSTNLTNKEPSKKPEPEKEESTQEVQKINDFELITDLSVKVDYLLGIPTFGYVPFNEAQALIFRFRPVVLKKELSDEYKLYIALEHASGWKPFTKDKWESSAISKFIQYELENSNGDLDGVLSDNFYIPLKKVNDSHKDLFGTEIMAPLKTVSSCPSYVYDEKNKEFDQPDPMCGGTTDIYVQTFKSKFETKGDEAYVYISVAFKDKGPEFDILYKDFDIKANEKTDNFIWSDYDMVLKDKYERKEGEPVNTNLNHMNYEEFSSYKFIFKKGENNNYYFVKVEQTK